MIFDLDGGHRMTVVTSKPTPYAERILAFFGLAPHFERVVGATLDGSLRHKADLIKAALLTGDVTADEAVMIGDRSDSGTPVRRTCIFQPEIGIEHVGKCKFGERLGAG